MRTKLRLMVMPKPARFEHRRHGFGRHADAVIFNDELVARHLRLVRRALGKRKADIAAIGRVLHRVAQQVDQNLTDAQAVAHHVLVHHVVDVNSERMPVVFDLLLHDDDQVVHQRRKAEFFLV